MAKNALTFHWDKRADRYVFTCATDISGDPDQYNEQLSEILAWCKSQKLKSDAYRFQASRRSMTEKSETFEMNGRDGEFKGSTVFHPVRLSVELDLPERLGPLFTMAFSSTDERVT